MDTRRQPFNFECSPAFHMYQSQLLSSFSAHVLGSRCAEPNIQSATWQGRLYWQHHHLGRDAVRGSSQEALPQWSLPHAGEWERGQSTAPASGIRPQSSAVLTWALKGARVKHRLQKRATGSYDSGTCVSTHLWSKKHPEVHCAVPRKYTAHEPTKNAVSQPWHTALSQRTNSSEAGTSGFYAMT